METRKVIDTLNHKHDASKGCIVLLDLWHTQQLKLKFGLIFLHTFILKSVNSNFVFLDRRDVKKKKGAFINHQVVLSKLMVLWNWTLIRNGYPNCIFLFHTFPWCFLIFFLHLKTPFLVYHLSIHLY